MPRTSPFTFEICVESAQALAAAAGFADRIELCAGLDVGGLTPEPGLMAQAAASGLETHVLIRGRSGDFTLQDDELAVACTSIKAVRQMGLKGIVIGAEKAGQLDLPALQHMVEAADGLDLTLHRVIDLVDDPVTALDEAIALGFKRVLTSGGAPSAPAGIEGLRRLCAGADGQIEIMAGGGITSTSLPDLIANTSVRAFHASCSCKQLLDRRYVDFGFGQAQRGFDTQEAERIVEVLRAAGRSEPD